MPLKHLLRRLGSGIQPVHSLRDQCAQDQQALDAFLRVVPVRRDGRGRDEGRVEVEVGEQERGRGEGRE